MQCLIASSWSAGQGWKLTQKFTMTSGYAAGIHSAPSISLPAEDQFDRALRRIQALDNAKKALREGVIQDQEEASSAKNSDSIWKSMSNAIPPSTNASSVKENPFIHGHLKFKEFDKAKKAARMAGQNVEASQFDKAHRRIKEMDEAKRAVRMAEQHANSDAFTWKSVSNRIPTFVNENQFDRAYRKIKAFDEAKKAARMTGQQQDNANSDFTWKSISNRTPPSSAVNENQFDRAYRRIKELDEAKKQVRMTGQQQEDNAESDFTWKVISNRVPPTTASSVKENQFDRAYRKIKEFDEAKKAMRMVGQQVEANSDFIGFFSKLLRARQ
eukprot:scaffold2424_cov97-Cylindrotheca_fusiformis.AAC.4